MLMWQLYAPDTGLIWSTSPAGNLPNAAVVIASSLPEQKREIWLSPETGAAATAGSEACDEASIDMDLEGELMYRYAGSEIRARFEAEAEPMLSQVRATPDDWTWSYHRDPDPLLANRRAALDTFLADYERGLRDCRYVVGELPSLPFFSH